MGNPTKTKTQIYNFYYNNYTNILHFYLQNQHNLTLLQDNPINP